MYEVKYEPLIIRTITGVRGKAPKDKQTMQSTGVGERSVAFNHRDNEAMLMPDWNADYSSN